MYDRFSTAINRTACTFNKTHWIRSVILGATTFVINRLTGMCYTVALDMRCTCLNAKSTVRDSFTIVPTLEMTNTMASHFDPSTIKYPIGNPRLILSVADKPIQLEKSGLKAPYDFYVESFLLNQDLTITGENPNISAKAGIYTHRLLIAGENALGFGFPGENGEKDKPNGLPGGNIELYVEDIALSTAQKLKINGRQTVHSHISYTSWKV